MLHEKMRVHIVGIVESAFAQEVEGTCTFKTHYTNVELLLFKINNFLHNVIVIIKACPEVIQTVFKKVELLIFSRYGDDTRVIPIADCNVIMDRRDVDETKMKIVEITRENMILYLFEMLLSISFEPSKNISSNPGFEMFNGSFAK